MIVSMYHKVIFSEYLGFYFLFIDIIHMREIDLFLQGSMLYLLLKSWSQDEDTMYKMLKLNNVITKIIRIVFSLLFKYIFVIVLSIRDLNLVLSIS